jgi:hypothetical protein
MCGVWSWALQPSVWSWALQGHGLGFRVSQAMQGHALGMACLTCFLKMDAHRTIFLVETDAHDTVCTLQKFVLQDRLHVWDCMGKGDCPVG